MKRINLLVYRFSETSMTFLKLVALFG